MWSKLGIRAASAIIGALVVICLIFAPLWVFNIAVALVAYISLYELYKTFKQEKKPQIVVLDYAAATAVILAAVGNGEGSRFEFLCPIFAMYVMLLLVCAVLWHNTVKFSDVSSSAFMLIYGVLLIVHLIFIRRMENGVVLIFLPLLGAWMPDTFAYFTGMMLGRHKLIPQISPKKTVEGAVGAVFGSVIIFLFYGLIIHCIGFKINVLPLVILAVLCGIIAQFGDLGASVMKREYGVKDFGNFLPGHGGILDRIDSLLFIAPFTYYFMLIMPVIG